MGQKVTVSVGNGLHQYELFRRMSQAVLISITAGGYTCLYNTEIYIGLEIYLCM